jgi:adiponectin receptor
MSAVSPHVTQSSAVPQKTASLCTIHEVESWQRENEYLLRHYRTASNSYRASLASLGYLHNQTGNVYTHLIGMALFMSWAVQTYNEVLQRYTTSDSNDFLVFTVFVACALFCFGSSACFHLFMHQSAHVNQTWLLFDLYGVFALITATVFSGTYYGFYCEREWWRVYSAGVCIPHKHLYICSSLSCPRLRSLR